MSELHETVRGGEHVVIRLLRPEDMALYPDFLADVSAEGLRLRFFARVGELSAAEADKLAHLDSRHEGLSSHSTKIRARCSGSCA